MEGEPELVFQRAQRAHGTLCGKDLQLQCKHRSTDVVVEFVRVLRLSTWLSEQSRGSVWFAWLRQNNKEFDRHLRYFTSAIGPVVEEAFFINEALNDMKGLAVGNSGV